MRRPSIQNDTVYVDNEKASGWDDDIERRAEPHEIVPALIKIIDDLQDRISVLERWRERART